MISCFYEKKLDIELTFGLVRTIPLQKHMIGDTLFHDT